jgi:dephospho-CoA kinase
LLQIEDLKNRNRKSKIANLFQGIMLKVGITGGIGSGKSTVAQLFNVLGISVYAADEAGKRLMNENEILKTHIKQLFGEAAYHNGVLNRKYIADIVFNNDEKLSQLNAIVHPATLKDADDWMNSQQTPYSIKEAAILFESGAHEHLDYVIGVSAPAPLRMQRAMQRDNVTREQVIARMNRQINETVKMRLCDFIIYNDEQQLVIPQVVELHKKLIQLSKNSHAKS